MLNLPAIFSWMWGDFSTNSSSANVETIAREDFLSQLPEELILRTFGFLSASELAKCGEVSRKWRRLASDATLWNAFDLRKISPRLKVFDESDWITHVDLSSFGLSIDDAPPLDKRKAIPALKRYLSSLQIEGNAGITLLTIPKGLTFNKLVELAGSPKVGKRPKFRYMMRFWKNISDDIPVDKTYRIVITNNVFEGSRHRSFNDQKVLVSQIGCEMPKILEVTLLLIVTFMGSGERLYSDNPSTYTRCSEQFSGSPLLVGGFSPYGVHITTSNLDDDLNGVGGVLRRFYA